MSQPQATAKALVRCSHARGGRTCSSPNHVAAMMMLSRASKYRGTFLPVVTNAILDGWPILIVDTGEFGL